ASYLLGGSLRSSTCAGISISTHSTRTWSARLVAMLRAVGAPDVFTMLFTSMVVTKATTSIGRDKFDLQILNARLCEIDDAQNSLVVQAVVDGHKQRVLFRGPAAKDRRHARGQFRCWDLLIRQGHLTVLRDPLLFRRPEDGARLGSNAQDQLRFGELRRILGGGSWDIDVVPLHQEW